jgi:hypothetical protein
VGLGESQSRSREHHSAVFERAKDMAENIYRALWSWIISVVVTVG